MWGMRPLDFQQFIFSVNFRAAQSDSYFMWLPVQTYLYSATAAAEVQLRLHERNCSLFTVLLHHILRATKSFVPPSLTADPGHATVDTSFVPDTYSNYDDDG